MVVWTEKDSDFWNSNSEYFCNTYKFSPQQLPLYFLSIQLKSMGTETVCYFFRATVFAWRKLLVTQFYVFLAVWILLCVLSQGWGLSIWMRCSAQVMSAPCGTAAIKTSLLRTANTLKMLHSAVMFHIWALRKRSEPHTHSHTHNISSCVLILFT